MSVQRLVYMANQIATFFAAEAKDKAAAATADHLSKFWDPRMRKQIIAHYHAGGAGLSDLARAGVALLEQAPAAAPTIGGQMSSG